jgi:Flp pilus assembly pilin Flp
MSGKKNLKVRAAKGQGLVEYALILSLVAVVVIVIIGLVGMASQRNFGVIGAVFGAKRETPGTLSFNYHPQCGYITGQGTGFYAEISTNIPITDLQVSTDTGFITALTPIAGGYKIQPILSPSEDLGVCPHGLVVQSSKAYGGETIVYPVKIQNW